MARPRKDAPIDLSQPKELTAGVIDRMLCPSGKKQAFLRDTKAPSLRVRVTASGAKSFVFEAKLDRKTIRRTIGDVSAWTISGARAEANRLRVLIDRGIDPRELDRQAKEQKAAREAQAAAEAMTFGYVWSLYLEERRPYWSDTHYRDHVKMVEPGGRERQNRKGVKTVPGPLSSLLDLRLVDLDSSVIEKLAKREAVSRPARVRLALRLLKAFLRWVSHEPEFAGKVDETAASSRKARESAGKAVAKKDHLQREQLSVWFAHVRGLGNLVISAYLQCLLLTGARREELASLKWQDINFQWKGITLGDKVEDSRAIPLTPYVSHLLAALPRRNEWVFSSESSESGRLVEPTIAHRQACQAAGLHLTVHGLRRSFKSLTEWLEVPVGVVAQIMGHKPSATAEKHYTVRPLDLLRVHHEKIETWILEQAGIEFDADNNRVRHLLGQQGQPKSTESVKDRSTNIH